MKEKYEKPALEAFAIDSKLMQESVSSQPPVEEGWDSDSSASNISGTRRETNATRLTDDNSGRITGTRPQY